MRKTDQSAFPLDIVIKGRNLKPTAAAQAGKAPPPLEGATAQAEDQRNPPDDEDRDPFDGVLDDEIPL